MCAAAHSDEWRASADPRRDENAQRDLFGFERTRDISGKSAQEIAEAAKAWGQNDDITVVTVRRNA